jgi:putative acetyltransferase
VAPACQGQGIGSLLIRAGMERARRGDHEIVFVVGEPAYYARFGFGLDTAKPFPCIYAGPYLMALWLTDGRLKSTAVIYPAAFDDLE